MKNIGNLMKQAQQMQARMTEIQARMTEMQAKLEMGGQSGGGMVTALMNGKGELKKITLDKSVVDPEDIEILEDLIIAAVADAKAKVESHIAAETQKLMGGLPLPAGMKLPF